MRVANGGDEFKLMSEGRDILLQGFGLVIDGGRELSQIGCTNKACPRWEQMAPRPYCLVPEACLDK